jgi:phage terminase large subunit
MAESKTRTITIPNDWKPREYQMKAWGALEGGKRRVLLVWHRRSGKDDVGLHWTATQLVQRPGTYWHMLPAYAQARKAIWEAVDPHKGVRRIDIAFPKAIRDSTREDTMSIRFKNGSYWHLVGSDNYDSLVGTPPVGIVASEWALADPNAWGYIRPILLENDGWAMFVTTSRGRNHAWKMYEDYREDPEWFVERLRANETGVFTESQLEVERREYVNDFGTEAGNALFEQEYMCSFEAPTFGAYFAAELRRMEDDDRITSIPIERSVPVFTSWDLGYSDSTAIWFIQCVGKERRLVDYHEASGMGFDYYAKVLKEKGYVYGEHYFPHDIAAQAIGMEKSRIETLRGLGITASVVPKGNVEDGINATRRLLDTCWIDRKRCARGLDCLRQYRREWDEKGKVWKPKPLHDWASHGADALRTFAVGFMERHSDVRPKRYSRLSSGSWMGG